ncbi:hypothetical protein CI109_106428 [Kwoniella shandongensis]|uniref:DCUN1 domain-containing protein n=1 Tax=Kwoniella shandongensis TaxID=1734106 RepID=A0AAJ8MZP7_9TREE
MAAPPSDEYLAEGFDANSLRVPQLRKAPTLRAAAAATANIRPSGKGIVTVSENGDESPAVPTKRARGRPRKTPTVELEEPIDMIVVEEPPAKKPRGRGRSSVSASVEVDSPVESVKKPRARPRKSTLKVENDSGEAEIEEEATPAPRSVRGRASLPPSTPAAPPSLLSAPPSTSRRRSNIGSSSSVTTEVRTPSTGLADVKPQTTGRKSDVAIRIMDNVREESEKEDETPKKISRPKTPRKSSGDESGFSDFNPFQSGSEEAAERARRRRKSSIGLGSAVKSKPAQPRFSEPAPSVSTPTSILRRVGPSKENLRTPPSDVKAALKSNREQLDAAVEYNHAIQDKLTQISSRDVPEDNQITISSSVETTPNTSLVKRVNDQIATVPAARATIPLSALFLLLLSLIANFKTQSSAIGYCDSGSNTNDVVLTRQSAIDNAQACVARKAHLELDNSEAAKDVHCDVSALPLLPFVPRPESCTICPPHAECADGQIVACAPEYILAPHPLSILSPLTDGLPGLGPRAFPPSCRPDTMKKRMIGGLAKEMERELAKGRGQVVCVGLGKDDGRKGEGERFGVEESTLRDRFAARRDPKFSKEQFDEIFESALKDLVEHEDVIESIDVQWKSQLGSTAAVLAAIAYLRAELNKRKQEKYRAEELAQVTLKRLQDQEQLHYTDPVTTPSPFIPPDQLRDLVMPPKGSTASRSRLWAKVQDLVESNANVAVREREVKGEVWKTWEWAGPIRNKDTAIIAEFREITGASTTDATRFVKKYKGLEASLDAYYNDPAAQSQSSGNKGQEKKLGEIWEKYKDPSDSKLIKIDGTMELCEELDIDPASDSVLFCLAADLGSKVTGEWEKAPFVSGIASYPGGIDSVAKLKGYLPTLRQKLNTDPAYFKKVYVHTFVLAKGQDFGARTLPLDTAVDLWTLFIPPALSSSPSALSHLPDNSSPHFTQTEFALWLEFIKQKGKAVSKDTWSLFVDFVRSIDMDFKEYDDEGAWPSTIDDFVDFVRTKRAAK